MIRILDDYVVVAEAYDYMLARDTGRRDKKTGAPDLKPISWHGSLRKAIVALRDYMVRKSLADFEGSLPDALTQAERIQKRFEDILTKAMGEER